MTEIVKTPRAPRKKEPAEAPVKAVAKKKEEATAEAVSTTFAVGRRKCAIARIRMSVGAGVIVVNGKEFKEYFPTFILQRNVQLPLTVTDNRSNFDFSIKVIGGGTNGQSEAVRHGIARALVSWNPDLKKTLRSEGLMTRDPRVKERKKPGLKRARRAPQFSKR